MQILTSDEGIRLRLRGAEQAFALRAKVEIPAESITSIRFDEVFNDWRRWEIRVPGTSLPGVLLAGSYWTEEGWDFMYIKRPHGMFKPFAENVLVIETSQSRYARILVTVDNIEASRVTNWWNGR